MISFLCISNSILFSRCSKRIWKFADFNHVISNGSYMIYGAFFILFARSKKSRRKTALKKDSKTTIPITIENGEEVNGEKEGLQQSSTNPEESKDVEAPTSPVSNLEDNEGHNNSNSDKVVGENDSESSNQKAVIQQLCIYYAMGMALICQGIFSICYHICPTNHSLQFDTTIMYIMCILGIVKIYQVKVNL